MSQDGTIPEPPDEVTWDNVLPQNVVAPSDTVACALASLCGMPPPGPNEGNHHKDPKVHQHPQNSRPQEKQARPGTVPSTKETGGSNAHERASGTDQRPATPDGDNSIDKVSMGGLATIQTTPHGRQTELQIGTKSRRSNRQIAQQRRGKTNQNQANPKMEATTANQRPSSNIISRQHMAETSMERQKPNQRQRQRKRCQEHLCQSKARTSGWRKAHAFTWKIPKWVHH